MTSHRREGPARVRGPRPSLAGVLELVLRTVLVVVFIGVLMHRLPFWAGQVAVAVVVVWSLVERLPRMVHDVRSGGLGLDLPRMDPDYSRRR